MQRAILPLLVSALLLLKHVSAECIDYDEHQSEIEGCCQIQGVLPATNLQECAQEAKSKTSDQHNFISCLFQCYSTKNGIINGQSVNVNRLEEIASSKPGAVGDAWKQVFHKCAGTSDEIKSSIAGNTMTCDPYALELKTCFSFEIDRVCPDEHFRPSDLCSKIRSGVPYCHHQK